jgi:hypothetical protein
MQNALRPEKVGQSESDSPQTRFPENARRELEQIVSNLNQAHGADATLPWQTPVRRNTARRKRMLKLELPRLSGRRRACG